MPHAYNRRKNRLPANLLTIEPLEPRHLMSLTDVQLAGNLSVGTTLHYQLSNTTAVLGTIDETFVNSGTAGVIEQDSTTTSLINANANVVTSQEFYRFTADGFVDTGGNTIATASNGTVVENITDSYVPDLVVYAPTVTAGVTMTQTVTDTDVDNLNNQNASSDTETQQITLEPGTQRITVGAGSFTVYVFDVVNTNGVAGDMSTSTSKFYVDPGVGLVQAVTTNDSGDVSTLELTSTNANITQPSPGTLATAISSSNLPASILAGAALKNASVSVAVTNIAAGASTGSASVTLYATTNGTIDSTSTALATLSKSKLALKSNASAPFKFSLKSLSLPTGTYTLIARTTDSSGNTTDSSTGPTVTVAPATVTLSATISAVKPSAPKPGKPATITLTINNTGNTASSGTLTATLGLSTDGATLSESLPGLSKVVVVKVGKPTKLTLKFTLPAGVTTARFPLVTLTQDGDTLTVVGPSFTPAAA